MCEVSTTGIKVSKMGFGSHKRPDMMQYFDARKKNIREAYDLGVRIFDVYDREHGIYQYEPMGQHLAPIINDVVISITLLPYNNRTLEQEFERVLRLFGRDYIDMVRCHAFTEESKQWYYWDKLFNYKEKGYIRAVGVPIHDPEQIEILIKEYPIDYVVFPYNFYHNICWLGEKTDNFDPLPAKLRAKGIGVVTMKPFGGDFLLDPFIEIGEPYIGDTGVRVPQAALRYIINSGINPDTTLTGMYNTDHVYENATAYFNPEMSDDERNILEKIKEVSAPKTQAWLPDHYKWLDRWKPA